MLPHAAFDEFLPFALVNGKFHQVFREVNAGIKTQRLPELLTLPAENVEVRSAMRFQDSFGNTSSNATTHHNPNLATAAISMGPLDQSSLLAPNAPHLHRNFCSATFEAQEKADRPSPFRLSLFSNKRREVRCCGPSGSPSRRHIIIFVLLHNIAALLFGWSRQACPARRMLSTRPPSASLQCLRWRCRNSCALPNRPFGVVASCARLAFLRCCLRTSAAHAQAALARTRRYEAVLLAVTKPWTSGRKLASAGQYSKATTAYGTVVLQLMSRQGSLMP